MLLFQAFHLFSYLSQLASKTEASELAKVESRILKKEEMNELKNNELQLALNRVCYSQDFKTFFTSRHHVCPNGMTISVVGDPQGDTQEAKKCFYLALVIRHYGYEDSSNRGISKYDDMKDFYPGKYDFTEKHRSTVLEYFKAHKPELYEKYMDGVTFYLDGI